MIRGHRPADLPAIALLDRALFADDGWDLRAWEELLAAEGRRAWVAEDADAVMGYALSGLAGELTELLRIAVRPDVRRRGVAGALLAPVLAAARADGAERVLLEVSETNDAAAAFYRGHGFAAIDRRPRYYRDGSAALVLELVLEDGPAGSGRMEP